MKVLKGAPSISIKNGAPILCPHHNALVCPLLESRTSAPPFPDPTPAPAVFGSPLTGPYVQLKTFQASVSTWIRPFFLSCSNTLMLPRSVHKVTSRKFLLVAVVEANWERSFISFFLMWTWALIQPRCSATLLSGGGDRLPQSNPPAAVSLLRRRSFPQYKHFRDSDNLTASEWFPVSFTPPPMVSSPHPGGRSSTWQTFCQHTWSSPWQQAGLKEATLLLPSRGQN